MNFRLGTSWYPELVTESEWQRDLSNMRDAGINLLRLFDFAWSAIEPREGDYQLGWVHRCLDMAHREGFSVVFCTPTASPPRWLGEQYPQIMIELADGTRRPMGARRDVCINSSVFRHFCGELSGRLASDFTSHPAVESWQIDNELIGPEYAPPECHCPECHWRFRDFLKKRYRTVVALNAAWGTRFWSNEFSDWGEVTTPRHFRSIDGHVIDYGRFFTESLSEFIAVQADRIRPHLRPGQLIGHNATGVFDRQIDHRCIQKRLDFSGWDAYRGAAGGPHSAARTGLAHELFRSTHHKPFLIYETGAELESINGAHWGEMRARGAYAIIPWHYRRHRSGVESGGDMLADYDGTPLPGRIEHVAKLGQRLAEAGPLPEKLPLADAAFVFSSDMVRVQRRPKPRWDGPFVTKMPYLATVSAFYEPLWRNGVRVDVLGPEDPLEAYRVVVLPADELVSPARIHRLHEWVTAGGTLVVSGRFALRSAEGVYRASHEPELIALLGGRLLDQVVPVQVGDWTGTGQVMEHTLTAYAPAAIHINPLGTGRVFYAPNEAPALIESALRSAIEHSGIRWHENPTRETCIIPDNDRLWLINHSQSPAWVLGTEVPPEDFIVCRSSI